VAEHKLEVGAAADGSTDGLSRWSTTLSYAKWASGGALAGSRALAAGVSAAATSLGSSIVSSLAATDLGRSIAAQGETESGRAARVVAAASIVAARDVMAGLEEAAAVFSAHAAGATTGLVAHRYGDKAAGVARQGLAVAGDIGAAAWALRSTNLVRSTAVAAAGAALLPAEDGRGRAEPTLEGAHAPGEASDLRAGAAAAPLRLMDGGAAAPSSARPPSKAAPAAATSTTRHQQRCLEEDASFAELIASMPAVPKSAVAGSSVGTSLAS